MDNLSQRRSRKGSPKPREIGMQGYETRPKGGKWSTSSDEHEGRKKVQQCSISYPERSNTYQTKKSAQEKEIHYKAKPSSENAGI